mgnify:CR=1 FL=1
MSDFGKINELNELDGTYSNESLQKDGFRLTQLLGMGDNIDSLRIQFLNDTTLQSSYLNNDGVLIIRELKGKKKKKYFEVYFYKEQFFIPLIYSEISVNRLRIGKYKKTNNLLIRHFLEQSGNFLIITGGYGGEKPYVYERVEK